MPRRVDAANLVRLTRQSISKQALEPGQQERIWWDSELPGFGYRLRGKRGTWVVRPPRGRGRSSLITLGSTSVVDVSEARKIAREHLAKAALGQDVRANRRAERSKNELRVQDIFIRYTAHTQRRIRPSTAANLRTHLDKHWLGLHSRPLASLRRVDIAEQLRKIVSESGPQAALRARRTLSTVFVWAIGEGLVEANPVVGTNPPAVEIARERVLADHELVAVWRACPPTDHFGRIVRLLILTGQRRDEIAGLVWSEVDIDSATLRLPAARTKNKRAHDVPLSRSALEIIRTAPRIPGRAFAFGDGAGPFSGFSKCKKRLDERLSFGEPWRLHDLRRTTATGLAKIGVSVEVVERALNHVSGTFGGVVGVYQRHDYASEKREALERWAEYIERTTGG